MRNSASAFVVGDKIYKTNTIILQLSEEISLLGTRLDRIKNSDPNNSKRQKEIVDMIKIRCELLGTLSQGF